MTGFPGFLGSALLPRVLLHDGVDRVLCVIQEHFREQAQARLAAIVAAHPHAEGRVELIGGDIRVAGLGLDAQSVAAVDTVWHLAAVYDLHVEAELAHEVNVVGTRNVVEFSRSRPDLKRLQYVSTCYVSGAYEGVFREEDLEMGQRFQNHYEETKYEAEKIVRAAMAEGLPATIYRPGVVVGDSGTGQTQKFDGPYFLAHLLQMQPGVAVVPQVADPDGVVFSTVPRDFVIDAMDALAQMEVSRGKTYALTDPNPPTVREMVDTFADHLGRRVMWLPLPMGLASRLLGLPGLENLLGIPAETLDYLGFPTRFDTTNASTDLIGTGITCPAFADYAPNLIRFFRDNPDTTSAAMV